MSKPGVSRWTGETNGGATSLGDPAFLGCGFFSWLAAVSHIYIYILHVYIYIYHTHVHILIYIYIHITACSNCSTQVTKVAKVTSTKVLATGCLRKLNPKVAYFWATAMVLCHRPRELNLATCSTVPTTQYFLLHPNACDLDCLADWNLRLVGAHPICVNRSSASYPNRLSVRVSASLQGFTLFCDPSSLPISPIVWSCWLINQYCGPWIVSWRGYQSPITPWQKNNVSKLKREFKTFSPVSFSSCRALKIPSSYFQSLEQTLGAGVS